MCSIAGILDKNGEDVSHRLKSMLELTEHRGPDGSGLAVGGEIRKAPDLGQLIVDGLEGDAGLGHSRLRITGITGTQPLASADGRFILGFNGEIWNYRELRKDLKASGYGFETDSDSEVIIRLFEEKFKAEPDFLRAVSDTDKELDGEYAFVIFDKTDKRFALVRDPVGIKQLYYGENPDTFGFCSEKKPLWELGIEPKRVLPGEIVEMGPDEGGVTIFDENAISKNSVEIFDEPTALKEYKKTLTRAIEKRIRGQKKVGIIFSGGVDSVLVAQIAKDLGADITCYASGFAGSSDIEYARKAAEELGFDLKINELTEEKLEAELKSIMAAIESVNHLQVDVAIPIFFAVKLAKEDGIRVMLTGQGADEIFAGYPWYPKVLEDRGGEFLNDSLWNDIKNLYKDTLEREDKIAMYHSIELRVPYLDNEVIGVGMSISEELKIRHKRVKYIHRKLADESGVPEFISWRPKIPAQDGSDVHKRLSEHLRKKKGALCTNGGTRMRQDTTEKLGSIYRYDYDQYKSDADSDTQDVLNHMASGLKLAC